jgi:hypothetical protein
LLYVYLSSALAIVAAIVHSYIGEVMVYRPLFAASSWNGAMQSETMRRVARAVWHLPSLCWILMAVMVLIVPPPELQTAIPYYFASAVYGVSGIGNLIATRGRHFGWIVLIGAAMLLLAPLL